MTEISKERIEELTSVIFKHLNSLPYAGGYPSDWREPLAEHIIKAGYSTSQAQWQLCPKCHGEGWLPTTGGYQTSTTKQCDVCHGNKLLAPPSISTRGEDAVEFGRWLSENDAEALGKDHWRFRQNTTHTTEQLYKLFNPSSSPSK